tara:strand:- start:538 stop:1575 length:1038 start_codon:yes stop_codon:yes gene_type:complete
MTKVFTDFLKYIKGINRFRALFLFIGLVVVLCVIFYRYLYSGIIEPFNSDISSFDINPATNVYGLTEKNEAFNFFVVKRENATGENNYDYQIIPYTWKGENKWISWYDPSANNEDIYPLFDYSSQISGTDIPTWEFLVDASQTYIIDRFVSKTVNLQGLTASSVPSDSYIKDLFNREYNQPEHLYVCTDSSSVICEEASNNLWYSQNCETDPSHCYTNAYGELTPYFDEYDNNARQFFKITNNIDASYSQITSDTIVTDMGNWNDVSGTPYLFDSFFEDPAVNYYLINDENSTTFNVPEHIYSQLPINTGASSTLTYNSSLGTYCGNVCFKQNSVPPTSSTPSSS